MIFELEIKEKMYKFKFGLGFMREIDAKKKQDVNGLEKNVGLIQAVAGIMDGELDTLADVLFIANKTENPRLTMGAIDEYLENVEDLDGLFETVLDFLSKANATKKTVANLKAMIAEEEAKQANKEA